MLQHKEWVLFSNPTTGIYQFSCEYRNVYYRALNSYFSPHFNDFTANIHIKVDCSVKDKLSSIHIQHVLKEFNN